MKSKFKKLMAAALVLCLMLALLPAGVLADGQYTITADGPLANGTVTVDGGIDSANENDTVTFTAAPNEGCGLMSVKVYKTADTGMEVKTSPIGDGKYTFTMPAYDVTITATFNAYHNVTCATSDVAVNSTSIMEGDWVIVTPVAKDGYDLDYVWYQYKGGEQTKFEATNGVYQFIMGTSDVTVGAKFTEKVVEPEPDPEPSVPTTNTVTTNIPTGGSVTATPSTGLNYGDTVTVTVQPYDGYYLKSLTVGGEDVTNLVTWDWYWNWYYSRTGTYSFAVTGNTSVVATFDTWYDGDIACIYDGRFGNVSLNVWSKALDRFVPYTSASKGDLVQVIVEPYNGYAMNSLSISERDYWGSSVDYWQSWKHDNVYYFYMPDSDVNLYVDFTEAVSEHIVYVDRAANGLLKADTTWAADGQIVYVTATPDTGYVLSSLFVKTAKGDQLKVYEAKKTGTYYFYMPDQYVTVSAYFAPAASALPFNDVAYTSWYYDAVKFVYDKGIMDGVSYYRFAPDATITRGMVVTMLWRMAGEPYEAAAGFTDVAAGRYYTTAVAWAAKNGIVEGMTATTFAPDQAITREQLASILYRYAKWLGFSGYGSDISGYTDAGKVSSYAYDAMSWAVRSGVVTGTSARVLDPQGTASRAAAAQMFMNFYNYIK